ncbi:zf-HC2 domain-containing protein [Halomonas alkalicola]|uniref:zf-HC2 domain-containing protein n=1 Tax=Halomonas alkalicola TaxID=1930622 RepID=UPI00265EF8C9|nr:zf-HC2 domain-containing protein [Halomonas alkalicola]
MMMCKGATRLMSLKQDRRLTFQERISLRLHLSMCGACRQCDRQFALLHRVGERVESRLADTTGDDASRQAGPKRSE